MCAQINESSGQINKSHERLLALLDGRWLKTGLIEQELDYIERHCKLIRRVINGTR